MYLNHKIYGNGNPLIILHGFLGSLDNWHTLATKFGETQKVYTIDQRNHGKSPHTSVHSIPLMVEDLKLFMATHQIKKASIVGHSMGGKVAMQFALLYPDMIDKLIVVDIAPKKYKRGHDDVLNAIEGIPLQQISSRKEAETAMEPLMPDYGTRQFLLKNLERTEDGSYQWKMNVPVLKTYYEEIIQEVTSDHPIQNQTLVIKGANSRYIKDEDYHDFKRLFPNFSIVTIPNAGHWVHAEQPILFYEVVSKFLSS